MFWRDKPKHKRMLETELEHTLVTLNGVAPESKEYADKLAAAERLLEMLHKKSAPSLSNETLATIAANLVGILLIIRHENVNFIASKALNFVRPLK